MYIVAIAWLYVTLMMAITEKSLVAGVMTFVFYGVLPLMLLLWLVGTPVRRARAASVAEQDVQQPDRPDTHPDQ